jgi:hypothetical protein
MNEKKFRILIGGNAQMYIYKFITRRLLVSDMILFDLFAFF